MIRTFLAALLFFCALVTSASAAPPDDPGRDSAVTDCASVSHASVTLDDSAPSDAAPLGTSPMLASVGLLGVAGAVGGSLLAFKHGDRVTYVDEHGVPHAALVREWHERHDRGTCTLLYVTPNGSTEYVLSVCRKDTAGVPVSRVYGRYWQPDGEPVTMASEAAAT